MENLKNSVFVDSRIFSIFLEDLSPEKSSNIKFVTNIFRSFSRGRYLEYSALENNKDILKFRIEIFNGEEEKFISFCKENGVDCKNILN